MEPIQAPLRLHEDMVRKDWIDYNGHMNLAFFVRAFDFATDAFFRYLDMYTGYIERTGCSLYVLETHVTYRSEMRQGDPMRFDTQLLDHDHKRLHFFHHMWHARAGNLAATNELLFVNVDIERGRSTPMPPDRVELLGRILAAHRGLPRPEDAGRVIGIRR